MSPVFRIYQPANGCGTVTAKDGEQGIKLACSSPVQKSAKTDDNGFTVIEDVKREIMKLRRCPVLYGQQRCKRLKSAMRRGSQERNVYCELLALSENADLTRRTGKLTESDGDERTGTCREVK